MQLLQIIKKFFKYLVITLGILLIIACILPYFFSIENKKLDSGFQPYSNSSFFNSHHTRLHYRVWKPVSDSIENYVLLIHGFAGSTFSFRNNIDTLIQNNYMVVALDLPAFGYSDKSDSADYTDSGRVEMIHGLLNTIAGNKKWNLVGHSMGASVIAGYACAHPEQTNKLIFIDGPAFESAGDGPSWTSSLVKFGPVRRWAEVLAKNKFVSKNSFKELLSSAYSEPADSTSINGYMKPFTFERSATAIFDMAANSGYAKIDKHTLSAFPMLLLWGENDQWIPIATASDFIKQNHEITFMKIAEAGHCPMETRPKEVNGYLVSFIKK